MQKRLPTRTTQKLNRSTCDRGEYRYALDVARYTVCVDRNDLLGIELERCNERRCRNVESRSVNERNVPLAGAFTCKRRHIFLFAFTAKDDDPLFQDYMGGIIIRRYLDAKLRKNINTIAVTDILQLQLCCNLDAIAEIAGAGELRWRKDYELVLYVNSTSSCKFDQTSVALYDIFEHYRYTRYIVPNTSSCTCPDTRHSKMQRGFNYFSAL
ncbi:unnamed protein product [Lasius platythorax]|uniref:Uncharacterized protein n=1 Tax=Lasius platythorax TaxID=488582 RepID=A0AAV2NUJ4_9HYME